MQIKRAKGQKLFETLQGSRAKVQIGQKAKQPERLPGQDACAEKMRALSRSR